MADLHKWTVTVMQFNITYIMYSSYPLLLASHPQGAKCHNVSGIPVSCCHRALERADCPGVRHLQQGPLHCWGSLSISLLPLYNQPGGAVAHWLITASSYSWSSETRLWLCSWLSYVSGHLHSSTAVSHCELNCDANKYKYKWIIYTTVGIKLNFCRNTQLISYCRMYCIYMCSV